MNFKSDVMTLNFNKDVGYLTFKKLDSIKCINHAFSTKIGGVSENEFTSMNLLFNRGDSYENVIENYHRFCEATGFRFDDLVASCQKHFDNIRVVNELDKGVGIWKKQDMDNVDALITNKPNIALVTYYADCTPLFFVDPIEKVIALAHSGWRGTVLKIGVKVINKMKQDFNCDAKNIVCAIGPCIGKCCYEVDSPVYEKFSQIESWNVENIFEKIDSNKYKLDLCEANKQLLMFSGIKEENISVSDVCTMCNSDILFSHRATNGKRGGMAAMLSMV